MRLRVGVSQRTTARTALAVGALGVVFGDIGTSPLYTIQTVFNPGDPHPVKVSADSIFGIVSLIFWSVTIIVTVTYVLLVMRADNDGEGGIMALITLIRRRGVPGGRRTKAALAALGIFGASLFFGDSMITPAISVLSAIEGVKVAAPSLAELVVRSPQRSSSCCSWSSIWARARWGACSGRSWPSVRRDSPARRARHRRPPGDPQGAVAWLRHGLPDRPFRDAFFSLAAVVLAVTGAEALYADMGTSAARRSRASGCSSSSPPAS